jgi:hypothetical protein
MDTLWIPYGQPVPSSPVAALRRAHRRCSRPMTPRRLSATLRIRWRRLRPSVLRSSQTAWVGHLSPTLVHRRWSQAHLTQRVGHLSPIYRGSQSCSSRRARRRSLVASDPHPQSHQQNRLRIIHIYEQSTPGIRWRNSPATTGDGRRGCMRSAGRPTRLFARETFIKPSGAYLAYATVSRSNILKAEIDSGSAPVRQTANQPTLPDGRLFAVSDSTPGGRK